MLNTLRREQNSVYMLRHLILVALICPVYTSLATFSYAPDYVLVNLFAVLFIAFRLLRGDINWSLKNIHGNIVLALTAAFTAIWLYFSLFVLETPWYTGPLNMVISFLTLFVLLSAKPAAIARDVAQIPFLVNAVAITGIISIVPYFFGYAGFSPMNGEMRFYVSQWWERYYSWMFSHKSEYSLLLILSLAIIVTFRRYFTKKWLYYLAIAAMAVGLYIANTRAAMIAAMGIFAGLLLDFICSRKSRWRWLLLLLLIPLVLGGVLVLKMSMQDRDLFTLGGRTYIWKDALEYVKQNPQGLWHHCGRTEFWSEKAGAFINNCHNVFLNYLLQFSIPGGICCILVFAVTIVMSFIRKPSFLTLGIWGAMLISMTMDWSLLIAQVTFFLVGVYFLFFCPVPEVPVQPKEPVQTEQQ